MNPNKAAFANYLDKIGIQWIDIDNNAMSIQLGGNHLRSIEIAVIFASDSVDFVSISNWKIASAKGKERIAVELCNSLNNHYRWIKFYVDEDSDIVCHLDAMIVGDGVGAICFNAVKRVAIISDEAYPEIIKSIAQ